MGKAKAMTSVSELPRIDKLYNLSMVLAAAIDCCEDSKSLAQLSRQYRETLKEIEEIKGVTSEDDEIGELLAAREAHGKPGAVRKTRA